MSKAYKIWIVFSLIWICTASVMLFEHYSPLQQQSQFIYNPMVSPNKLLESNAENRETLIRTYPDGNIYSFGIRGVVNIEFSKQAFSGDVLYTWMPHQGSFANLQTSSSEWLRFREGLVMQALAIREKQKQEILDRFLLSDLMVILGIPALLLLMLVALKGQDVMLKQPTGNHFPDL